MRVPRRNRGAGRRGDPGFALAAVIFALVVLGALVAGALFAAREALRVAEYARASEQAAGAAEAGVQSPLSTWRANQWHAIRVGDSVAFAGTLPGGTGRFDGSVLRLNAQLFLVRVAGSDRAGTAQRTVAALARPVAVPLHPAAALTARGAAAVGGPASVDGRDTAPPGWSDCPPASGSVPGVVTGDSAFAALGNLDWAVLASAADKTLPAGGGGPVADIAPAGTATSCDVQVLHNWGDPRRPAPVAGCRDYFPIIYVEGDLVLRGGSGQGILVVRGDLDVSGGAEFFGLVVVSGRLTVGESGGRLVGAVVAANEGGQSNSVLGGGVIAYSSCAVGTALRLSAPVRALAERSWLQLY